MKMNFELPIFQTMNLQMILRQYLCIDDSNGMKKISVFPPFAIEMMVSLSMIVNLNPIDEPLVQNL